MSGADSGTVARFAPGESRSLVKAQVREVIGDLEVVLGELKDVAKELKEVVSQIDVLTSTLNLEEETDDSNSSTLNSSSSSGATGSSGGVTMRLSSLTATSSHSVLTVIRRPRPPPPPPRTTALRRPELAANGADSQLPSSSPSPELPAARSVTVDLERRCARRFETCAMHFDKGAVHAVKERVRFSDLVQYHGEHTQGCERINFSQTHQAVTLATTLRQGHLCTSKPVVTRCAMGLAPLALVRRSHSVFVRSSERTYQGQESQLPKAILRKSKSTVV